MDQQQLKRRQDAAERYRISATAITKLYHGTPEEIAQRVEIYLNARLAELKALVANGGLPAVDPRVKARGVLAEVKHQLGDTTYQRWLNHFSHGIYDAQVQYQVRGYSGDPKKSRVRVVA